MIEDKKNIHKHINKILSLKQKEERVDGDIERKTGGSANEYRKAISTSYFV